MISQSPNPASRSSACPPLDMARLRCGTTGQDERSFGNPRKGVHTTAAGSDHLHRRGGACNVRYIKRFNGTIVLPRSRGAGLFNFQRTDKQMKRRYRNVMTRGTTHRDYYHHLLLRVSKASSYNSSDNNSRDHKNKMRTRMTETITAVVMNVFPPVHLGSCFSCASPVAWLNRSTV